MPVRYDKIRYGDKEWTKPVYFCRCGAFGHFSETIGKKREWYCGWDREAMKPVCRKETNDAQEMAQDSAVQPRGLAGEETLRANSEAGERLSGGLAIRNGGDLLETQAVKQEKGLF